MGFILSLGFFIWKIFDIENRGPIRPYNPLGIIFSGSRDPLTHSGTLGVDGIEMWMTFAYINFRFHLPPDLFREYFVIKDTRYPNIPLNRYVKKNGLDGSVFLKQVKDIVRSASLPSVSPSSIQ